MNKLNRSRKEEKNRFILIKIVSKRKIFQIRIKSNVTERVL